MKLFKALLTVIIGLATGLIITASFGCAKLTSQFINSQVDRAGIDPAPEKKASQNIAESFQIEKTETEKTQTQATQAESDSKSDLKIDQAHVEISNAALGKEFLLSTNMLSQTPTPMFASLQSRIVSFILRDNKIYMLDVTKTNLVGDGQNIPQNLLIAEFDILKEKANSVVIDFNGGMKQIFTAGDMFSSDDANFTGAAYSLPKADVLMSYLDEVKFEDQALFIRQVAQLAAAANTDKASAVEVRYQIKPYLPDQDFVPVKNPGFDKVGYFEANPIILKDGSTRLYSMKWNEKKPIIFAISANTPEKYRELVKNSVLHWNKILGENKVQVIQLEDKSITAPNFQYNIIQWADWDAAGYAYADAHVDPRSGQVTSAQVFFPSAFINANVPKRIRQIEAARTAQSAQIKIGLRGFSFARYCQRPIFKDLEQMTLVADGNQITDAAMDKAMRDYVYEVIAHEVGHVLGLRHNFAGNLVANYDYKDRKDLILSYYKNMKSPEGIVDSSSVMEYSRFEESSWNGDLLQRPNSKALSYDDMAISYLYFNKPLPENRPPFCTDSQIATYADCNMSDAGRSIVSASTGSYQLGLNSLAAKLINLYISKTKLADDSGLELIPVSEVDLNAKGTAKSLGLDLAKFISLLKVNTKLIAVRSALLPVLSTTEDSIKVKEQEYLSQEVNRLGGLQTLTSSLPNDFDTKLVEKFSNLLENSEYNSGVLTDGSKYSFTEAEKQIMKTQVGLFASQVKQEFILNEIKALSGESYSFEATYGQAAPEDKLKWVDSTLTEQLADILFARYEQYSLAKTDKTISSDVTLADGTKNKVELPIYAYPQKIRLASVSLLLNGHEAIDWGYLQKAKAIDEIQKDLSLIGDEDKIDKALLSKDALKWLLSNKQIQSAFEN